MSTSNVTSRTLWQGLALAGILAGSLATAPAAFAGECPAGKMQANVRDKVDHKAVGVTDVTLGCDRPREAAGQHQGSRTALPQADDRARRHRAVAQP